MEDMEAVKELAAAPVYRIPVLPEIRDLLGESATLSDDRAGDDELALLFIIAEI